MLLPKYLLRIFLPVFAFSLAVLTGVAVMGQFLRVVNLALVKGIGAAWILQSLGLVLPYFLGLTTPIAFLVALLLTMGALAETGEMIALRAAGFSARQALWPLGAAALVLSLALLHVNHSLAPGSWRAFKDRLSSAGSKAAAVDPEPRTFFALGDWKLFAGTVDREKRGLGEVHLFQHRGEAMRMSVSAPRGSYALEPGRGLRLHLEDGELVRPDLDEPSRILRARFEGYELFIPFAAGEPELREPLPSELESSELARRIAGAGPAERWELNTQRVLRSAAALSPLAFLLAACPLGIRLERKGRAVGFGLSLGLLVLYNGLLVLGVSLGRRSEWLSWTAPWLGTAGLAALGAGLLLGRRRW